MLFKIPHVIIIFPVRWFEIFHIVMRIILLRYLDVILVQIEKKEGSP